MKIRSINIYQVPIPFGETAYSVGKGKSISSIDGTLVSIDTDEGLVGWGEISPWGRTYLPEFAEGARAILSVLAPCLIGEDPTNLAQINHIMDSHLYGHGYGKSALDMACWDILGKATNQPVCNLLGGRIVDKIPMNCAVYNGDAEDMISKIQQYREQGIRIFSTKPYGDTDKDIELYKHIANQRQEGETYIADANRVWSVPVALRVARVLQDYGFFNLEQPCNSYEECLQVRRASSITMAIDESIVSFDNLVQAFRDNAADIIHIKLSHVGGLTKAKHIRDFCIVAGLSLSWATSGGTEITDVAATHIASATPLENLFGLWSCREFNTEKFAKGGPITEKGYSAAQAAPGLGVDPIMEKLGNPFITYR